MIEFLYKAMHTPLGIIVRCAELKLLRDKLYAARRTDPDLKQLSLVPNPLTEDELFIVKRPEKSDAEE